MIVMKFGGTSVGSAERLSKVLEIVERARGNGAGVVVVLSAMSGVTNALIKGAELAQRHDLEGCLDQIRHIAKLHKASIEALFSDCGRKEELIGYIDAQLSELEILYRGIHYLGELTKRSLDAVSSFGELFSSKILAALAESRGLRVSWVDAREFLVTDDAFGRANPLWDELTHRVKKTIVPALKADCLVVTQGFIGATVSGAGTTLGRGGSDFSASIIGVAVDADEIQIWTDVDGMMTADPRVIPDAQVLPEVSFEEAAELAYFGAKVLHPSTIQPAVNKNIPVRILNSLNPSGAGTIIKAEVEPTDTVRAVASKKGITAIFVSSPRMLMNYGFLAQIFAVFDRYKTPIDLISTSEISVALTIDQTEHLEALVCDLAGYGEVRVMRDVAIVSVVGMQFREQKGIAGPVFSCLTDINILMISGGASDINLSFVVNEADAEHAVDRLHSEFFNEDGSVHVTGKRAV